jgi:protocatechuate 3,4-dioxygenase beta subunit
MQDHDQSERAQQDHDQSERTQQDHDHSERTQQDHNHSDPFDQGLLADLQVLGALANRRTRPSSIHRRNVLGWLAVAGLTPIFGCGGSDDAASNAGAGSSGAGASGGGGAGGENVSAAGAGNAAGSAAQSTDCSKVPEETAGPYPGDGTNGPNILTTSGIVRDDIRSSFDSLSGTAAGIPLTIQLKIVSASNACAALAGYAVYLWHCDRDGHYSMYTAVDQNYLRGVQETDSDGVVTFKSIFPACYSGRWPHIHFEVFKSLEVATAAGGKVATSQLALPKAQCDEVFASAGYEASVANLTQVSLATDMVFSDGASSETPSVTGNVSDGYLASLTVAVAT